MEDFIIILIGFALMAYSAYSKNQKTRKKQRAAGEDDAATDAQYAEESGASKDILEQFFGYEAEQGQEKHPFAHTEAEQQNREAKPATASQDTHYAARWQDDRARSAETEPISIKNISQEGEHLRTSEKSKSSSHVKKRRRAVASQKKQHWFNARKAVIYSEIINRKY